MAQYRGCVHRWGTGQCPFHGVGHTLSDLLALAEPAALAHLLFLIAMQQEMRRLVTCRAAQTQNAEISRTSTIIESLAKFSTHLVPVVGGELPQVFVDLGGTWQHQQYAAESTRGVPGEQHVDAVILVTANVAEVIAPCFAVHLAFAVGVDGVAIVAHHSVTEGMTHLWDVPRPPGDGTQGTSYPEQNVTRNAGSQGYFAKIPMKDYGEVAVLTENTMVNDLASDAPGAPDFSHLNYASTSATGIAIDGVLVYPTLNNTLEFATAGGELSSVGIHSGRGMGVHYHADSHSATASGLNLYNAADYIAQNHPPIITFGFDGVAGYGKYIDTESAGATQALDEWGGHEHGVYAYHYHAENIAATAVTQGPDGSSFSYTAHLLPPKGAWRGRINDIPSFWAGTVPAYGGRPGVYQGIGER